MVFCRSLFLLQTVHRLKESLIKSPNEKPCAIKSEPPRGSGWVIAGSRNPNKCHSTTEPLTVVSAHNTQCRK